ncbi:hypothetical protein AKJ41_02125 [candidate division MSBL1 archaeon SCGC-AAA259O05]|uniref:Uncharacterized protein n=1 Tax=candidate division MSBL1 archaeon SCGC-AAA259O05 TaxID=1698271 RepID=A0A133V4A2_9EURY|nr:hypothetical protein AKJ41_02125 [candidate division MSBL1 archaeon SCGC-AAA259O05]
MKESLKGTTQDRVARKLRGDVEKIVEERDGRISVRFKGHNFERPYRPEVETFPKEEPEGRRKLIMIRVEYHDIGQDKVSATLNAYYFRPGEEKLLQYCYDPPTEPSLRVIHEDPWAGNEEQFEVLRRAHEEHYDHHEVAYLNPEPVPGGEGDASKRSGFMDAAPKKPK